MGKIIYFLFAFLFLIYFFVQSYNLAFHTKKTLSGTNPLFMSKKSQEFLGRISGFIGMLMGLIILVIFILYFLGIIEME